MARRSRPRTETELADREAKGLWLAIARANELGESNERITIARILAVHRTIFSDAIPEIAGKFRRDGEDVKKLKYIEPPPGRLVQQKIYEFWREFDQRISLIPRHPKRQTEAQRKKWFNEVLDLAARTQHQIAAIHPFSQGNGRMARLMTNVVLRRFGLPPASVNYEGKKAGYLAALGQIDRYKDYGPLKRLIAVDIQNAYKREQELRQRKVA